MNQVIDALEMGMKELNREIRERSSSDEVRIRNAHRIHGLGSGLRSGTIRVEGDCGDYLGMLNSGARFEIDGDCGRFLGDGMTSGEIVVHGSVEEGAGEYCYGGSIVIEGNAGDFLATMNKGGSILVNGDVGKDAATYMLSGALIIMGSAGSRLANYLIGGSVYVMGEIESLGANTRQERLGSTDIDLLTDAIGRVEGDLTPRQFKKFVPESSRPFYGKKADKGEVK